MTTHYTKRYAVTLTAGEHSKRHIVLTLLGEDHAIKLARARHLPWRPDLANGDATVEETEFLTTRFLRRKSCTDCSGTGAVPALGGEDPELVDNGLVACPTCTNP